MANADQTVSLIKCHLEGDDERFRSVALQISATEARAGHPVLAKTIKDMLNTKKVFVLKPRMEMFNSEVSEYLLETDQPYRLPDLVVAEPLEGKINRIIKEYIQRAKLEEYNLGNRRKILLVGPSGTGKTMTASVIANELKLPLFVVRLEKIITKFMGETSLKLSKIFNLMEQMRGVYLFDEFDAIGQQRGMDNEVGEMRRILTSFLQMMERDSSDSLILAATNDINALDKALFRRFDDVLEYTLPNDDSKLEIMRRRLHGFSLKGDVSVLLPEMRDMSHAEICMVCTDAIKESLLNDKDLTVSLIKDVISMRCRTYHIA
ncbi:MAG: ATP-binding protein [Bacteroidales bacterium]|nr:ATP-binding protein [Bacteroidales bacterium]